MSMHRKPLTELEEEGLYAHGLIVGTPSQLSDAFRQGVAWALSNDSTLKDICYKYKRGTLTIVDINKVLK